MPFVHITTRLEDRKHEELLFDKGGNSFPSIMFLDAEGEVIAIHKRATTMKGFEVTAALIWRYLDLKKKVGGGDASAKTDLLITEGDLGRMDFYELEEELDGVKLTADQQEALKRIKADSAATEQDAMLRNAKFSDDSLRDAGEEFLELYKEGARPSIERAQMIYWWTLGLYAGETKNAAVLEEAIKQAKTLLPHDKFMKRKVIEFEVTLAKLK
ncbi:MAG: hypothetical protein O7E54_03615 [Planctomycetota bacterium]|nr:hypothetical protein [Planctomycetota bacterium]